MSSVLIAKNVLIAIDSLAKICENKDLKVTLVKSTKAGIISGAGAFLGGLLFGKTGAILGGAVGTGIAAYISGDFMSLAQVLRNLDDEQKKELCELLCDTLKVSINRLISILIDYLKYFVIDIVLEVVKKYLLKEKNLKLVEY